MIMKNRFEMTDPLLKHSCENYRETYVTDNINNIL